MMFRIVLLLIGALALVGCDIDPSTRVQLPTTIRPNPTPAVAADGSIYRASNSRPLYEDRRARFVGDTITVLLVEKTSSNRNSNDALSTSGTANVNITAPTVLGVTPALPFSGNVLNTKVGTGLNTSFTGNSTTASTNKQADTNSNVVAGSITVTVIEVLPNGNLMVSGEKLVSVNEGTEFVRLSGVVNPVYISGSNTVNSTQIADAKIESKENQSIDTAQVLSGLARFFTVLFPF
jgi:flagellar L-ring protein precursor FlgH